MSKIPPEKLFDDVSRFIADSRDILKSGAVMELDGLDGEVKKLCDAIMQISQEEREIHAVKLQALLKDLTALGNEMMVQRDSVVNEMRGVSDYRKAHVAYSAADATDAFGKKKDDNGDR